MNDFNIPKIDFAMQKQYAKMVYDAVEFYVKCWKGKPLPKDPKGAGII